MPPLRHACPFLLLTRHYRAFYQHAIRYFIIDDVYYMLYMHYFRIAMPFFFSLRRPFANIIDIIIENFSSYRQSLSPPRQTLPLQRQLRPSALVGFAAATWPLPPNEEPEGLLSPLLPPGASFVTRRHAGQSCRLLCMVGCCRRLLLPEPLALLPSARCIYAVYAVAACWRASFRRF
jgi:hypothetical protein